MHNFTSTDQKKLCEISRNNFVFASKGGDSYSNFESFLDEFWTIWETVTLQLKMPALTRVGLRKVNLFPFENDSRDNFCTKIRHEFLPPIKVPFNGTGKSYLGRQSFILDNDWKCNFHFGTHPKSADGKLNYFFDTDIFKDHPMNPQDLKEDLLIVNNAHWEIFCNTITNTFFEELKVK